MTLRCKARYYDGVPHYLEWYKGRVGVYTGFSDYEPYIHPALKVFLARDTASCAKFLYEPIHFGVFIFTS